MRVLVACEYSGRVRQAFRDMGHDAWSCDLLPSDDASQFHVIGDIDEMLMQDWDLLIAHPPCTYLANSGVKKLHTDPARWPLLFDGAAFFKKFVDATHIPMRAIENPIMHKYGKTLIGGIKQSQVIQPWMFGHAEQKATCLWLFGLPHLKPTNNVKEDMMRLPKNQRQKMFYLPPSPDRWKLRSTTYQGIAEAMACTWGML